MSDQKKQNFPSVRCCCGGGGRKYVPIPSKTGKVGCETTTGSIEFLLGRNKKLRIVEYVGSEPIVDHTITFTSTEEIAKLRDMLSLVLELK